METSTPLEVAEGDDAALAVLELGLGEEHAFFDPPSRGGAPVARLGVALDLDALDVDERSASDRDDDVDFLLDRIELGLRLCLDVGVACVAVERADGSEVLHELGAIEVVAALRLDELAERLAAAERLDLATVGVALVDLSWRILKRGPSWTRSVISMPSRSGVSMTRGVPI